MQTYPLSSVPPAGPKNYVFVDEHNRHKRLKVMRACEGCRRRKIKCDSATTNTWPCAACVRLKLHCVPPAGGLEGDVGDLAPSGSLEELRSQSFSTASGAQQVQSYATGASAFQLNQNDTYAYEAYPYQVTDKSYNNFYTDTHQYSDTVNDQYQNVAPTYAHLQDEDTLPSQERNASSPIDQYTTEDLMDQLGQLKITDAGVATYMRYEKSTKEVDPPMKEPDPEPQIAAAFRTDAGSQIRIPPALMPSDEDATEAFDTYFVNVHPYVPVLNRSQFYQQWQNDPTSISPLILEAVFANAGRLSDDPAQGAQWLALANSEF